MKNRIALVTGGMGALGTAICRHFADLGATVIAAYNRSEEKALEWQIKERELGYQFEIAFVDVTDFASCVAMTESILTQHKRLDILVNNAGIAIDSSLYKMELSQWLEVINTNLNSVFNVTRNIIPQMIENKYGRIINISSVNGQKGQFGQTNYAASKAGIHGFTKSLALEVAKKGITVNTISPGYLKTEMVMKIPAKIITEIISQIPVARLGETTEVARLAGFLAAEENSYITGADFSINGGLFMH